MEQKIMNDSFANRLPFHRCGFRRRGFSLTEIAIVLMVVGSILAAIWATASQVNEKTRVTEALGEMQDIAKNMTSLLQGGYGVTVPGCVAGGGCPYLPGPILQQVIPPQWLVPGGGPVLAGGFGIRNPWDAPAAAGNNGILILWPWVNNSKYSISFYNVSRAGCIGLLTQGTNCVPGSPGCPVVINTAVNAPPTGICSLITTVGNPPQCTVLPLTSAEIQANCDRNFVAGNSNSVEFGFSQ